MLLPVDSNGVFNPFARIANNSQKSDAWNESHKAFAWRCSDGIRDR